jgi:DNA-binding response OmpR family regulator
MADLPHIGAPQPAVVANGIAERAGDDRRRPVVLIVDDNSDLCEVVTTSLAEQDFRIECAYSADEALRMVGRERIDLALIDLVLPGAPGTEVAERLAAHGAAVIMMSGALDAEERLAGTGFELLRKPFRLKTLLAMICDAVRGGASA